MKKTLIFFLIFSLLFSACGSSVPQDETTPILYESQNGYEISYPDTFSPISLSSDIDFVIMDESTGSSVTVLTEALVADRDITEKSFRDDKLSEGMDITITSFEQKEINTLPAYEITYKYNESTVTEIVYVAKRHIYRATYTRLPGTPDKLHEQMLSIITSLCA